MNDDFDDTLTTTCAAPVYQSNNLSSDRAEMTENHVKIESKWKCIGRGLVVLLNRFLNLIFKSFC